MTYFTSSWRKAAAAGVLLLTAGIGWTVQAAGKGSDWPAFLGPQRTGMSPETGFSTAWQASGPKKLWEHQVGEGYSCVSVSGPKAYTMGNAGGTDTVFCFDAVTGKEVWKKSYPCGGGGFPGPRCSPTVDGDRVYTVSIEGQIHCWGAADGKEIWSHKAAEFGGKAGGWGFACSPLIMGDKVIVDVGTVVALDKATGKLAWKSASHKAGYSSPVLFKSGGRDLLAIFNAAGLMVITADGGKPVAATVWKTSYDVNAALPVVSGDEIFITSGYGKGGAVFKLTGNNLVKVWENRNMASQFSTPVLVNGLLYGVSGNVGAGPIRCLDFKTGEVKWTAPGSGALIVVGGKLVVLGAKGRLAMADAAPGGYKELASADLGGGDWWNAPVLANGLIYCRSHQGKLVCLDVRK